MILDALIEVITFYTLGLVLLIKGYPLRSVRLGRAALWMAGFALLYGLEDSLDILHHERYPDESFGYIYTAIFALAFVLLMQLPMTLHRPRWVSNWLARLTGVILFAGWSLAYVVANATLAPLHAEALVENLALWMLGVPASLWTAWALFHLDTSDSQTKARLALNMASAGFVGFALSMVFEADLLTSAEPGWLVSLSTNMHVVSAVVIMLSMLGALSIFDVQQQRLLLEKLDRMRSERSQISARHHSLLEISNDAIISTDNDFRIILFSRGAERVFGYATDEILGQHINQLLPEEARSGHEKAIWGFQSQVESSRKMGARGRIYGLRKDGEIFPAEASIARLGEGEDAILTVTLRDVSETVRFESALTRSNRVLETLSAGNEAMTHAENETELENAVCSVIVKVGAYEMAWLVLTDHQAPDAEPLLVAEAGKRSGHIQRVLSDKLLHDEAGTSPCIRAIRTGEVQIIHDMSRHSRQSIRQLASDFGFNSIVSIPLSIKGHVAGALSIHGTDPVGFQEDEVSLLSDLASDLSYGIEAQRDKLIRQSAEQALQENEKLLNSIVNTAPVLMVLLDKEGKVLLFNSAAETVTGLSAQDIIGQSLLEKVIPPRNHEAMGQRIEQLLGQSEQSSTTKLPPYEMPWLHVSGNERLIEWYCTVLALPGDKRFGILGMGMDITERRRDEDTRRRLSDIIDSTTDAVAVADAESMVFSYLNPAGRRLLGMKDDQPLDDILMQDLYPGDVLPGVYKHVFKAAEREGSSSGELDWKTLSGKRVSVSQVVVAHRDSTNQLDYYSIIARDQTQKKRNETALRHLAQHVATEAGQPFFEQWAKGLLAALDVDFVLVLELTGGSAMQTRSRVFAGREGEIEALEYDVAGTICEQVMDKGSLILEEDILCINSGDMAFPVPALKSFVGISLRSSDHETIGVAAVMATTKVADTTVVQSLLEVYAASATAELERLRGESSLRASEQRFALAARGSNDALWDWDLTDDTVYLAPRWLELFGYEPGDIEPGSDALFALIHPDDIDQLKAVIGGLLAGGGERLEVEYRTRTKQGDYRWILSRALAVRDATGQVIRLVGSQTDIDDRKQAESQLRFDATHDALTGLANRTLLHDRLSMALSLCRRHSDYYCALLFFDLDRFKVVNDSLGHAVGDALLVAMSGRFEETVREGDTVARPGGDEFLVLLEDVQEFAGVDRILRRIRERLAQPVCIDGQELFVTSSVGVTASLAEYASPEAVIRDADIAMYRAKAAGGDNYSVFNSDMHTVAMRRIELEQAMRKALSKGEFVPFFQPIVRFGSRESVAFEALVRWLRPDGSIVSPADFIPVAEETGLIVELGAQVLQESCAAASRWRDEFPDIQLESISVNVSPRQINQGDVVMTVADTLAATGLPAALLKLEITEEVLMGNAEKAQEVLTELSAMGIELCLDDFGTGYSSLSYLSQFPFDILKIDQAFVRQLPDDRTQTNVAKAILELARAMDMEVVAEGIEQVPQSEWLQTNACTFGQGYLFAKPLNYEDATQWLTRH